MVNNIVETIQKNLGYQPLQKVDPNTQEIKEPAETGQKLPQAAIPAVLAAMLKFSDSPEGVGMLTDTSNKDWLSVIFYGKEKTAVQRVAAYAGVSEDEASSHMQKITQEALKILRNGVEPADGEKLRTEMNLQRHNILGVLPAAMKIGDLINEEAFDDRTNKMEGPVSGFLHRIENII